MNQQVIFIDGGTSKANYKNYFDCLNKIEYKPFEKKKKKWKLTLSEKLGDEYDIFMPTMPNKDFTDYLEWKVMFEKVFPFLKKNIILVGHSLGATFLCKYLEENIFPVKIIKILLIAPAFKDDTLEVLGNFNFNLKNFHKYEKITTFYHSKDDFIVPFNHFNEFKSILPNSKYKVFNNRGHFIEETFPEIIVDIKK